MEYPWKECRISFIHSPGGHSGCFQVWAVMTSTAVSRTGQMSLQHGHCRSLGYILRSGLLDPLEVF